MVLDFSSTPSWTAEVCFVFVPWRVVCRIRSKGPVYENNCRRLAPLFPAEGCNDARLGQHWLADQESAVLEDCRSITKNKVNGAGDGAVTKKWR